MTTQLRFFASVREALGVSHETVDLPPEVRTVDDVRKWLRARGGIWATTLEDGKALRMAYNQQMCGPDTPLTGQGEIAFFPPVTGG